jgi:hypothetical protein
VLKLKLKLMRDCDSVVYVVLVSSLDALELRNFLSVTFVA